MLRRIHKLAALRPTSYQISHHSPNLSNSFTRSQSTGLARLFSTGGQYLVSIDQV